MAEERASQYTAARQNKTYVCVFIHPVASLFEQDKPPGVMFIRSPLAF